MAIKKSAAYANAIRDAKDEMADAKSYAREGDCKTARKLMMAANGYAVKALDLMPKIEAKRLHQTVRSEMKRFMDRLEAYYGKRPIIYTSVDFHRDNLNGYFSDYYFWVRSVAAHPERTYADRSWAFWQYTSTGVIPGIRGPTDINVFAGSAKNWNNWVADVSKDRNS